MYSMPRYAASDTMTMLATERTRKMKTPCRATGSLRSSRGHGDAVAACPIRRRRRSRTAPAGISARPARKTPGRIRKNTMPMYGLVCNPKRSARKTTRKSAALNVTSAAPVMERRFRNTVLLLQAAQIRHERVNVVVRERVLLHLRLAGRLRFRSHALRVGDPASDLVGRELAADAVERPLRVALPGNRVAQRTLLIPEQRLTLEHFRVLRRCEARETDAQRRPYQHTPTHMALLYCHRLEQYRF